MTFEEVISKLNKMHVLLAILIISLIVVLIIKYAAKKPVAENFSSNPNKIVLYYANSCGWCQKLLPEWKKFKELRKNKLIIEEIECEQNSEDAVCKQVPGYPSVIFFKGGSMVHMDGSYERTVEGLSKFVAKYA